MAEKQNNKFSELRDKYYFPSVDGERLLLFVPKDGRLLMQTEVWAEEDGEAAERAEPDAVVYLFATPGRRVVEVGCGPEAEWAEDVPLPVALRQLLEAFEAYGIGPDGVTSEGAEWTRAHRHLVEGA